MNSRKIFKVPGELPLPDDEPSVVLQKATLTCIILLTTLAGGIWAAMYTGLGHPRAALIPSSHSICIGFAIIGCILTKRYKLFVKLQLTLIFILPFALHYELGRVMASGCVMVWGFLAPLGSALFQSARAATFWMLLFVGSFLGLIAMDSTLSQTAHVFSTSVVIGFFAMNLMGALGIVFVACRRL